MSVPITVFCEVTWQGQAVTARRAVTACLFYVWVNTTFWYHSISIVFTMVYFLAHCIVYYTVITVIVHFSMHHDVGNC